jgi:hypothetical protein
VYRYSFVFLHYEYKELDSVKIINIKPPSGLADTHAHARTHTHTHKREKKRMKKEAEEEEE